MNPSATPSPGAHRPAAPIWLRAGQVRAAVRPELGASLAGLWWEETALLRSVEPSTLQGPRQSACFALLPYSNRIGHCRFQWQGQPYTTQPNFDDHPHSLHGVGWQRPWQVLEQGPNRLRLALHHPGDADWPFAFEAQQTFELSEGALRLELQFQNTDTRVQPVGLGWHPYFVRRLRSHLSLQVAHQWVSGADALPLHAELHGAIHQAVAELNLDHCFDQWQGPALIEDELARVELSASTAYAVVFTPLGAAHFCVEPVSHVNNAIQSPDPQANGLVALAPGAFCSAWMRLSWGP